MSFSQEMKDFLGAWQSTSKMNTDAQYKDALTAASKGQEERASDEDTLETAGKQAKATLAHTLASTGAIGQQQANKARELAIYERMASGQGGGGSGLLGTGAPAVGSAPAPAPVAAPALPAPSLNPEVFAEGGAVPDGSDDDEEEAPTSTTTDISARRKLAPQLLNDGHDAVKAAYEHNANAFGLGRGGLRTLAQKQAALAMQQGQGGLTPQEMDAARKAIDPDGTRYSDSQRNMAALGSVYRFWMDKGEPDKAQRVAGQMLQHYNSAATRYAAIAAHAAKGGDLPLAAKAATMAYANVPDGKDFHIEPSPDDPKRLIYYYTDEKGNDIAKGIATPDELASSAMGMASGGFHKALMTAAGQREEASGKKGAGPKPGDDIAVHKLFHGSDNDPGVMPQMKEQIIKANPKLKDDPSFENHFGDVGDLAQHIYKNNIGKATPREAAQYAARMLTPGKADPEKQDFKIEPGEDGVSTVKFNDGQTIKLADDELGKANNVREQKVKAAVEAINKGNETEGGGGTWDALKRGYNTFDQGAVGAINNEAANFKRQAGELVGPEMTARAGSTVDAVKRAASDYVKQLLENDKPIWTLPSAPKRGAIPDGRE